jgi:probable rRNA maturation factor
LIQIQKEHDDLKEARLRRFVSKARKAVGLRGEVSLLLTSDREMRKLNRSFRGKDKATDVLSFPAVDAVAAKFAGDLAISIDTASANAAELGHSLEDELRVLILHGLLHLAGYDHEADEGQMARKESRLRRSLGLPSTLIARTEGELVKRKKPKPRSSANGRSKGRGR